jgi:hypothetical protein
MSLHENTIRCFIHLLKTQPQLFSDEAVTQLSELITAQPDDPQILSDAICEWGEKYPDIDAALFELEASSKDRAPGTDKAHISISQYPTTRKYIINVIQQSFPAKPQTTPPTNR